MACCITALAAPNGWAPAMGWVSVEFSQSVFGFSRSDSPLLSVAEQCVCKRGRVWQQICVMVNNKRMLQWLVWNMNAADSNRALPFHDLDCIFLIKTDEEMRSVLLRCGPGRFAPSMTRAVESSTSSYHQGCRFMLLL